MSNKNIKLLMELNTFIFKKSRRAFLENKNCSVWILQMSKCFDADTKYFNMIYSNKKTN